MEMTTLAERIAAEVMNTIEREQRVSKDDITEAASKVLGQHYMQKIAEANTRLRETMEAIRPLSGSPRPSNPTPWPE